MTEGIGQQLRQARQARSLSLAEAAQATHIRLRFLEAMESGQFEILASPTQARGFLRTYATYLRLDPDTLLAELTGEPAAVTASAAPPSTPEPPHPLHQQAGDIFIEIGQRLCLQRETLGLSLEDVERHTHLRSHYLQALEAGQLENLPSPVQGRGMLKNYAAFLGLDPEPLLIRFADGLQTRLAARQATRPIQRQGPEQSPRLARSPLARFLFNEVVIGVVLVISLLAFLVWGGLRIADMRSGLTPTPTSPSIAEVLAGNSATTPSPAGTGTLSITGTPPFPQNGTLENSLTPDPAEADTLTSQPGLPTATATLGLPTFDGSAIQVYIVVRQRAWMRIIVDNQVDFEGRVLPGSAYTFSGTDRLEVLTGNAAGLQVYYNQQDLGTLGLFGEVAQRIFTQDGVQTPTASVTPTSAPATPAPTELPPGSGDALP